MQKHLWKKTRYNKKPDIDGTLNHTPKKYRKHLKKLAIKK